jgi:hypothetical protein
MATAQEVYDSSVQTLPAAEQLRLASLILEQLTRTAAPVLDYSDTWTGEDIQDVRTFSVEHAASVYPEENLA